MNLRSTVKAWLPPALLQARHRWLGHGLRFEGRPADFAQAQRLSSEGLIRVQGANVGSVLISSAAIGELLARMRASADGKMSRVHSRVCFSDLLATKSAFHMSLRFADLVASIESSELPLYLCGGRDGYQLDDFYCKRADIEGWKRKYRVSAGGRSSP